MERQGKRMKVTQLNHIAIHVADLERSRAFYEGILGLHAIARPAFKFPGAWYRLGVDQELHLIARDATGEAPPMDRHYALMVDDIDAFVEHLEANGVEFRPPKPRPDGAIQVFLRDPDNHVIELCTPPGAAAV